MNGSQTLNASFDSVESIINSDTYKKIRLEMLNGIVPEACKGCKNVEDSGGESKRKRESGRFQVDHALLTNPDGSITPNIKDLELRLGNYCNLKCRGCNAESSTSWIQDYHKLKNVINLPSNYDLLIQQQGTRESDYSWCESENFYENVLKNAPELRRIHISGGEPFLVPKHFELIEKLINSGNTNIDIHYITNLNYNFEKLKPALDKLKFFGYVNISFSIDDVAERNSYIRSLSDWNLTISNLNRFLTEYPEFKYSITQTVNVYNFLYVDELFTFLTNNNLLPPNGILLNHIHAPEYLNANVLPIEIRQQKLDSVRDLIPNYMFDNLYGRYYNANQIECLEYTSVVTAKMDNVRNESVIKMFPKLIEETKNINLKWS